MWVCTVCPDLSVGKLRNITVNLNNKGAGQPAHPHSLTSAFVVHCKDIIIPILAKS